MIAPLDVVKNLQERNSRCVSLPNSKSRVGFAFNTKDRVDYTIPALASIDEEDGFDLIWADGSDSPEGRKLPYETRLKNVSLVEIHSDVRGGPDRAICFGLKRLLDLGYDYCGLIENDIIFEPGWFKTLMGLFERAAADGIVCGAATVRGYQTRVIEYRDGYFIGSVVGAGMVLFSRPAAQLLLDQYQTLAGNTSRRLWRFYGETFGIDLRGIWELWCNAPDRLIGMDWGYSALLYRHGYASIGSIPSIAQDMQFEVNDYLRTNYVGIEQQNSGVVFPPIPRSVLLRMKLTDPFFKSGWWVLNKLPRLRNWIRLRHKPRALRR